MTANLHESDSSLVAGGKQRRLRLRVRGRVQGVGFRPYVYGLADELDLGGWVCNDAEGVLIEVEGERCSALLDRLVDDRPKTARIDALEVSWVEPRNELEFSIRESRTAGPPSMAVAADFGVCDDCLRELFDPGDRRYAYPFINCTQCGPRYTIAEGLPYDRPRTAMAGFAMCDLCEKEYRDPRDRRFHAQATACPTCGPRLSMSVAEIATRLRCGQIVAVKGLGGFHLACEAGNEAAVARLRRVKGRDGKPFAVMVANVDSARPLAFLGDDDARVLTAPERPILLVQRRSDALAPSLAPGLSTVGLMLPYTPLHYLIFHELAGRPGGVDWLKERQPYGLVVTSANPAGEPLVIDGEEARRRLAGVADATADHDRPIRVRCDDSVLRVIDGAPMPLRRARGMVPDAIQLPRAVPPILAVGGDRKVTVCVAHGREAYLSQHIGSPDNPATVEFFEQTVRHLLEFLDLVPVAVAHDLHPDFLTTRYAEALGIPTVPVQHHHAHAAAVMAEHGISEPAIGVVLDGYGLGEDGTGWGGELLLCDGADYRRIGHLMPLRQPGGDRAAREPWRMAAAALHALGRREEIRHRFAEAGPADGLVTILDRGVNAPWTSSCGRLFDAAAGLLGVRHTCSFEGEAAMALESLVREPRVVEDGWCLEEDLTLSFLPLLDALSEADPSDGADLFHGTLIAGLYEWIGRAVAVYGITRVTLSGGCFANKTMTEGLMSGLRDRGLDVLLPRQAPPNDGGLSLGQAWVAAEVLAIHGRLPSGIAQPELTQCA